MTISSVSKTQEMRLFDDEWKNGLGTVGYSGGEGDDY